MWPPRLSLVGRFHCSLQKVQDSHKFAPFSAVIWSSSIACENLPVFKHPWYSFLKFLLHAYSLHLEINSKKNFKFFKFYNGLHTFPSFSFSDKIEGNYLYRVMKGFRNIQLFKALAWCCSHSDRGTGKDFYCLKAAGEFSEPGCHCHPLYISFKVINLPFLAWILDFRRKIVHWLLLQSIV